MAEAELGLLPGTGQPIAGLAFDAGPIEVIPEEVEDGARPIALLKGRFPAKSERALMCDQERVLTKIRPDEEGKFTLSVPLNSSKVKLRCYTLDISGNMEEQNLGILFNAYNAFLEHYRAAPPKRLMLVPSVGYSLIQHRESANALEASIHALTAKVSATYLLIPPWLDVAANVFATALPLSISGTDASVRYLGFNVQGGVAIPRIPAPWRVVVRVGGYYNRMFVSDDSFGYSPALCPTVTAVVKRMFKKRDSVQGYFKYVPIPIERPLSFSFGDREIGVGVSWARTLVSGQSLHVAFDFASLGMRSALDDTGELSSIETASFSLSFGYGF
jgi:hypothetical protein